MNQEIGWISIALTLIFGIPTIIVFYQNRKTRLYLIEQGVINVVNRFLLEIKGLEIIYKGKEVRQYLFQYSAVLICLGNRDITKSQIEYNPYVELPRHARWVGNEVRDSTKDLDCSLHADKNTLRMEFNLLKNGDYVWIDGYFTSGNANSRYSEIGVNHRIANIPKIIRATGGDILHPNPNPWWYVALLCSFLSVSVLLSRTIMPYKAKPHELKSTLHSIEGDLVFENDTILCENLEHLRGVYFAYKGDSIRNANVIRGIQLEPFHTEARAYISDARNELDVILKQVHDDYNTLQLIIRESKQFEVIPSSYYVTFKIRPSRARAIILITLVILGCMVVAAYCSYNIVKYLTFIKPRRIIRKIIYLD